MQSGRDGLVPIGEAFGGLDGPVKAIREAMPQALHHYTQADQVNQLIEAREADPDLGFVARLMVLCSLPRTNPGNRLQYVRRNGPYHLYMIAGGGNKLPYGSLPRLLLAWVCTEAVRTQSRELVLGRSLSEFMRTLDIYSTSGGSRGDRAVCLVPSRRPVLPWSVPISGPARFRRTIRTERSSPWFAGPAFPRK